MDLTALALFGLALLVNAGAPGPSILALVARVLARGWRDVAPFVAAMWLGEVAWMTAALFGLSTLAARYETALGAIKILGIGYLLVLAWQMWREAGSSAAGQLPPAQSPAAMFGAGLALTLGNPKIIVFYLALLPSLIDVAQADLALWATLAGVCVAVFATVDGGWILFAHQARRVLRSPAALRLAGRAAALMLCAAAGVIALT